MFDSGYAADRQERHIVDGESVALSDERVSHLMSEDAGENGGDDETTEDNAAQSCVSDIAPLIDDP